MIRIMAGAMVWIAVFATSSQATEIRNMCRNFFAQMNINTCMTRQEAARSRMAGDTYYENVVDACTAKHKIKFGVTYYTDFLNAEKCAIKEQRRLDQEEEMRANAARDRAMSRYFDEAAKTERSYRKGRHRD